MNEPIQEKTTDTPRPSAKARSVVAHPGSRSSHGCHHVAHGWEKAGESPKSKCLHDPNPASARSKRNEDYGLTKPNSGTSERATRSPECSCTAKSLARCCSRTHNSRNRATHPALRAPGSTEDPIQTERKRRQYVSLFSSNVALSYRKTAPGDAVTALRSGVTKCGCSSSRSSSTLGRPLN